MIRHNWDKMADKRQVSYVRRSVHNTINKDFPVAKVRPGYDTQISKQINSCQRATITEPSDLVLSRSSRFPDLTAVSTRRLLCEW